MENNNLTSFTQIALDFNNKYFHPLTCGNATCNNGVNEPQHLILEENNLRCPVCGYTQDTDVLNQTKAIIKALIRLEED